MTSIDDGGGGRRLYRGGGAVGCTSVNGLVRGGCGFRLRGARYCVWQHERWNNGWMPIPVITSAQNFPAPAENKCGIVAATGRRLRACWGLCSWSVPIILSLRPMPKRVLSSRPSSGAGDVLAHAGSIAHDRQHGSAGEFCREQRSAARTGRGGGKRQSSGTGSRSVGCRDRR